MDLYSHLLFPSGNAIRKGGSQRLSFPLVRRKTVFEDEYLPLERLDCCLFLCQIFLYKNGFCWFWFLEIGFLCVTLVSPKTRSVDQVHLPLPPEFWD